MPAKVSTGRGISSCRPSMRGYESRFLPTPRVLAMLQRAIASGRPFSLIRLGSGEAMALAHDVLLPVGRFPFSLDYSGVTLPDEEVRKGLLQALVTADLVGLSTNRAHPHCAPLLEAALDHFGIWLPAICPATINWELHQRGHGPLYRLLEGRRVFVVGRKAEEATPRLHQMGVQVAGTTTLDGYDDMDRAFRVLAGARFDVALVAAGIPATVLCPRIARMLGKVAIDFGHCINDLISPGFGESDLSAEKARWRALRAASTPRSRL